MPDDNHIRARFFVTKNHVTIFAKYHEVTVQVRWKRIPDDQATTRHLRTLVGNLDTLIADGLQEVIIQSETKDLDQEWLDMDEPPPPEEPASE